MSVKKGKYMAAFLCLLLLLATLIGCGELWEGVGLSLAQMKYERQLTAQWEKEQLAEPMEVSAKSKQEVTEELLAALSEKDAERIKAMLCPETQAMEDIDRQIQAALDFFEGRVLSYDDDLSGSEGKNIGYGRTITQDRRWWATGIQTDAGKTLYDITVNQYLVSYNLPRREGIVQLNIGNDAGEEVVIGYEWTYYSAVAQLEASRVLDWVREGAWNNFCCKRLVAYPYVIPDIKEQVAAASAFIEGTPYNRQNAVSNSALRDLRVRIVQEEQVKDHAASRVYLEIYAENIVTDAGKEYEMEIYMYYVNTEEADLEGVMQVVLRDEKGNTCTLGENFHTT